MKKPLTIKQFLSKFPTDEACLDHLFKTRFGSNPSCPKCGEIGKFRKLTNLPAYTCNCGHHIHPMVGTPFWRSRTSLQKWFYAMFLFTTTRNGVSAKEIQRQLGVTYKCAHRMTLLIREYMGYVDGDAPLGGSGKSVEIDKGFIGKKHEKSIVLGMVERGGELITRIIPDRGEFTVSNHIRNYVKEGSHISTDKARAFYNLKDYGYTHSKVNHSHKEYVRGTTHVNTVEGFWAWFKRGVNGTHVHVSKQHLDKYLQEFEFRFNLRKSPELMFPLLISSFPKA